AQDDLDRLADVRVALGERHAPGSVDARRERERAADDPAGVRHDFAFRPSGRQMRKNGTHQNTMFSRKMKMNSTKSAQIVMIGIDSEQTRPMSSGSGPLSLPSVMSLSSDTRESCCLSWSESSSVTFLRALRSDAGSVA